MKRFLTFMLSLIMMLSLFNVGFSAYAGEHKTMLTAKEYVIGETVEGTLDKDRIEFIKFTLNKSGKLSFKAEGTSSYQVYIFQANNVEQYFYVDYVKENKNLGKAYKDTSYYLLAGTYYFKLNNDSFNDNNYSITTSFSSANESFLENFDVNNDYIGVANEIEIGKTYNGMLGLNDKNDYYKIVATNGKYTLNVNSNIGMDAILLDSNGNRINDYNTTRNYTTGKYERSETFSLNDGVYYFRMYDYSGSCLYTFSVSPYKEQANNVTNVTTKPAKVKINKVKANKKSIVVYWNTKSNVSGYEIQTATDKSFKKNKKTYTVAKKSTNKRTIKKLKSKKKYYVRVRAYKNVNGKKIYGKWSDVKSVKVK